MQPNDSPAKTGLLGGLIFAAIAFMSLGVAFICLFMGQFGGSSIVSDLFFVIPPIGYLLAAIFATKFLKGKGVSNYLLIGILGSGFGIVIPIIGALVMFPFLTKVLGNDTPS